jgi:hypothetical protein
MASGTSSLQILCEYTLMILDRSENYDSLEASKNSRFSIDQTQAVYAALICPCIDITYYLYT